MDTLLKINSQLSNLSTSTLQTIQNGLEQEFISKISNSTNPHQIITLYDGDVRVFVDDLFDEASLSIIPTIRVEIMDESLTNTPSWYILSLLDAISKIK